MKNLTKGPYKKFQVKEYRRDGSVPEGDALLGDVDWIAAGSPLLFHADLKVGALKEERRRSKKSRFVKFCGYSYLRGIF
jgi:hypothetical protein